MICDLQKSSNQLDLSQTCLDGGDEKLLCEKRKDQWEKQPDRLWEHLKKPMKASRSSVLSLEGRKDHACCRSTSSPARMIPVAI